MVKIHDEPDCGNAPRKEIVRDFVVSLAERNSEHVMSLLAEDIAWKIVGDRILTDRETVLRWVTGLPKVDQVVFGSLLTHGRGASADGVFYLADGTQSSFCHVLRFASAVKTAKIVGVNTYAIVLTAAS
ncbi:hypothetical protein AAGW05_12925 [Arthrobacter sp. LAPM80]|uniref:hypothetical protein n=1 Tax=Arthrobacter sp. LAPM80 TaxID=3141788 RepID=UPI00398AD43F